MVRFEQKYTYGSGVEAYIIKQEEGSIRLVSMTFGTLSPHILREHLQHVERYIESRYLDTPNATV